MRKQDYYSSSNREDFTARLAKAIEMHRLRKTDTEDNMQWQISGRVWSICRIIASSFSGGRIAQTVAQN